MTMKKEDGTDLSMPMISPVQPATVKRTSISEDEVRIFLSKLSALTHIHGIVIGGCGCCGYPCLLPLDEEIHLVGFGDLTYDREHNEYIAEKRKSSHETTVRKVWTQEDVKALEQRVRAKVQHGEKLSAGEDTIWGVLKHNKPLDVRLVSEVDFMMGFDD